MEPFAQLLGSIVALGSALAGHYGAGRRHPRQAPESDQLPGYAHRSRRLGAVTETTLPFEDAVAAASTGDIWLFRGRSLADRTIQAVTNSPVNHVGMAVAIDDLPALLWHAELGRSLPDVWTGQRQRGVQLHVLRDAVTTWDRKYGQRAWMRQLHGEITKEHEDRLMEVIEQMDGKPFPTTVGLAGSWAVGPAPCGRFVSGSSKCCTSCLSAATSARRASRPSLVMCTHVRGRLPS